MARPLVRPFLSVLALVLLAMTSVQSASMLAPDRDAAIRSTIELYYGTSAEDFCGDEKHGDHRCPFCRLLPEAPRADPVALAVLLQPHDGWRRLASLTRDAQARNLNHSARAPPSPT